MKLEAIPLAGLYRIVPEVHVDDRGELWRSYCRQDLAENGLAFDVCQSNVSVNLHRHTLRGFHYQRPPSTEQKILTVMVGSLHAVIVDIRPDSPTFLCHESFRFEVGDRSSLLVPDYFQPENYTGFRYDDPAIGVDWPAEPAVMSDRDRGFGALDPSTL